MPKQGEQYDFHKQKTSTTDSRRMFTVLVDWSVVSLLQTALIRPWLAWKHKHLTQQQKSDIHYMFIELAPTNHPSRPNSTASSKQTRTVIGPFNFSLVFSSLMAFQFTHFHHQAVGLEINHFPYNSVYFSHQQCRLAWFIGTWASFSQL